MSFSRQPADPRQGQDPQDLPRRRLAIIVSPAQLVLFEHSTGVAYTALLGAVARLRVADFLEQHGPADAEALARGLGLNADALHRTLRALSNAGIFTMSAAGSFFESIPPGSDAYLMKNILHDWDDETCRRLLTIVRMAMGPKARLILCEMLVEKNSRNLVGTCVDLQMMIACPNGRERSLRELCLLLEATGFRRRRAFPFPTLSVIEAEAV